MVSGVRYPVTSPPHPIFIAGKVQVLLISVKYQNSDKREEINTCLVGHHSFIALFTPVLFTVKQISFFYPSPQTSSVLLHTQVNLVNVAV